MAVTLDPTNPSIFINAGTQSYTPGASLVLDDESISDFITLYAVDPDAAAGITLDVVATFQVTSSIAAGADAGNRIAINDGQNRSAIAACVVINSQPGIALMGQGAPTDPASYPVFVPIDWTASAVTIRLRRYANGDAELVEIQGGAPPTRALLTSDKVAGPTRSGTTVEFGCASVEAQCTVAYSAFKSVPVANPIEGKLSFTRLRIRDTDSTDKVAVRADYTLGAGSTGIDPTTQPVTIRLSTAAGQFYPAPDFNPINGFTVKGQAPKRRWTISDSEAARTGLEQFVFDENPNNGGSATLRDLNTNVAEADFTNVTVEITIGTGATANHLSGTATLVRKPPGSDRWRLTSE